MIRSIESAPVPIINRDDAFLLDINEEANAEVAAVLLVVSFFASSNAFKVPLAASK